MRLLPLAHLRLQPLALLVDLAACARAAAAICASSCVHVLLVPGDLLVELRRSRTSEFLRFLLRLRDALLDGAALACTCDSSRPRVRSASTFSSASCWRASVSRCSVS